MAYLGPIEVQPSQRVVALVRCVPEALIRSASDGEAIRADDHPVGAHRAPVAGRGGQSPERAAGDNRPFVNGARRVLRSSAHRRDLPERYGAWKSARKRLSRRAEAGARERTFAAPIGDPGNEYLMLDTAPVYAHRRRRPEKEEPESGSGVFPRWIDHRGLHARRQLRSPLALPPHARPDRRCHTRRPLFSTTAEPATSSPMPLMIAAPSTSSPFSISQAPCSGCDECRLVLAGVRMVAPWREPGWRRGCGLLPP